MPVPVRQCRARARQSNRLGDTPKSDDLLQYSWASFCSLASACLSLQPYQLTVVELPPTPPCARPIVPEAARCTCLDHLCPRAYHLKAVQQAVPYRITLRPRMPW